MECGVTACERRPSRPNGRRRSFARGGGRLPPLEIKLRKLETINPIYGAESGLEHATPYDARDGEKWCQVPERSCCRRRLRIRVTAGRRHQGAREDGGRSPAASWTQESLLQTNV